MTVKAPWVRLASDCLHGFHRKGQVGFDPAQQTVTIGGMDDG